MGIHVERLRKCTVTTFSLGLQALLTLHVPHPPWAQKNINMEKERLNGESDLQPAQQNMG